MITQNNGKDAFEELREALRAFMTNKGHGKLGRNIKGMIKLNEDYFVKTNLDYSTCMKEVEDKDNGGRKLVITNALKKATIDSKYNAKNKQEIAAWIKYDEASSQALNILEYQLAPAVLAEVKKDVRFDDIYDNNDVIELLEIVQDVVNAGQYGGQYDSVYTNLEQYHEYLLKKQEIEDVDTYSKSIITKYKSLVSVLGKVPFGEKAMVDIIQSGSTNTVTMTDYYTGSNEDRVWWDEQYMHIHVVGKLIYSC